jgi:ribosomal-protein-alanine N-acetyltransferase
MISKIIFQNFPTIDLGDIILREIRPSYDAKAYFEYMSKDEMKPFLTDNNIPKNIEQANQELSYWGSLFQNQRSIYWAIALKETDMLIGTAGFNMISFLHSKSEISYDLDCNFWGQGIMLKSIKSILKLADNIGMMRTQATVIEDNIKSLKLLERCGFVREGILQKYELVNNVHRDYFMYAKVPY